MPSIQSYLIHPFLRFFIKRKLSRATDPMAARASLNNPLPPPKGVRFSAEVVGGVPGEWVESDQSGAGTLLYLHGGGYFAGSPTTHRAITGAFALQGFRVFCPDYRLAPEHPFPAAVDDALAVYRAMLGRMPAGRLVLGGDSAGGGLTLALLLAARAAGLVMPACALLFSPWTDLACTGESVISNARRESMLYGPRLLEGGALYLAGADAKNPLASPLYGDLTGLPPLLIQAGEPEVLRDDSTRLAERARAAGVPVAFSLWRNMPHAWQIYQAFLPEARTALEQAAEFARAHLASPPGSA